MRFLLLLALEFYKVLEVTSSMDNSTIILPSFVMILDQNNTKMLEMAEILDKFTLKSERIKIEEDACTQLLTLGHATTDQVHFLFGQEFSNVSFCEPHVFGPIPDVIQVRFPIISKEAFSGEDDNFVTFQLTTKGGVIGFDVELERTNSDANLLFAINNLMKISKNSPGYVNGVVGFHRKRNMIPNVEQVDEILQVKYERKLKNSHPIEYAMCFYISVLFVYASAVSIWLLWEQRIPRPAGASASNAAFSLVQNDYSIEANTNNTMEIEEKAELQQDLKSNKVESDQTQCTDKSESAKNIQSFSIKRNGAKTCPIRSTRVIDYTEPSSAKTPMVSQVESKKTLITQKTASSSE